MGVTGLWQIVQPCARPIKIETLNRRRLAVDASIWIYQFLKAVRDKEGNALRNSHVVGFFRRICKLLFFGIKPVFVFDGGAPALKRATIAARKSRREGRREDAVRTAGKLLAVQMQRAAEQEEQRNKMRARGEEEEEEEEEVPDMEPGKAAYVEEIFMTEKERKASRKFKKTDAYHLPELDMSLNEMGGAADPRIMSLEELESYAKQFETGEDINVYDFSKIDYDGPFFMSLPASDRYNILNAARLRSRLRMGHSKEQLDSMFPDRMAFSKFQIERVRERNELTQRLMNLNGFQDGPDFGGGRVAGEKGREYVLVKNDGVEGGWALGVISDEGKQERPIDLDQTAPVVQIDPEEEWEEDDDFEDVPIEGLNRLPKQRKPNPSEDNQLTKQRQNLYRARKQAARRRPKRKETQDPNSLFVQSDDEVGDDWQDVGANEDTIDDNGNQCAEDEELQRAIAMSLEKEDVSEEHPRSDDRDTSDEDNDMLEVFHQSAAAEQKPLPKGSGRAIASIVNKRAFDVAPESREITSFGVPTSKPDESDEENSMDFQAALAESRRTKRKATAPHMAGATAPAPKAKMNTAREISKKAGFSGPLPFESLDLGSSLLGKKKMQQRTEEASGGFENPDAAAKPLKKPEPLPPWFAGDLEKNMEAQKAIEDEDRERAKEFHKQFHFQDRGTPLRRHQTDEVVDLEADDGNLGFKQGEVIDLEADDGAIAEEQLLVAPPIDDEIRMGDMADKLRAEPPTAEEIGEAHEQAEAKTPVISPNSVLTDDLDVSGPAPDSMISEPEIAASKSRTEADETLDWTESDDDGRKPHDGTGISLRADQPHSTPVQRSRSPSAEFEDVAIPDAAVERQSTPPFSSELDLDGPVPASGLAPQDIIPGPDEFDDFSDPEEAEMLRALTLEAEEHARFASSLNNKSQAQNVEEYERELKKLRNQQKKDRRDADEVTHIMITECQQLLRLFGLPYITAPMEAEAQCAELVNLGLVDGIVTDDSDCFLFGGTRIYKNMFNQAKFVECYLTSDLEKEFSLTRDKLISIAQLLGSDYTEGLPGVGPVTALEILAEFPSLTDFKDWWGGVQTNAIPKNVDAARPFRKKFRRNATRLFLPSAFPDARVQIAYEKPEVDSDPQPFQWGVPDLAALRSFLMATIGWSQERTDEVLVPVIRDMNRREDEGTQANITAFFEGGVGVGAAPATGGNVVRGDAFAPRKKAAGSKRMGSALSRLAERAREERSEAVADETVEGEDGKGGAETGAKRRRTNRRNRDDGIDGESGSERLKNRNDDEESDARKGKQKGSKSAKLARRSDKRKLEMTNRDG